MTDYPHECGALTTSCYYCTRPAGHTGRHAAGDGDRIIAVWPQDDTPTPERTGPDPEPTATRVRWHRSYMVHRQEVWEADVPESLLDLDDYDRDAWVDQYVCDHGALLSEATDLAEYDHLTYGPVSDPGDDDKE